MAADARLTEATGLWLDESLLTGESLPVLRQTPGEPIRAGSLVAGGRGWAEVVAMGRRGTAVAREAADLVLLHDDFAALVEALALARRIDANLHRALGYTLAIHLPIAAVSLLSLLLPRQGLLLACWPGLAIAERRSLVFAALLLAGGGLVWVNGDQHSPLTRGGALVGAALWVLIQLLPGLPQLLQLVPLQWGQVALALGSSGLILTILMWIDRSSALAERRA